MPAVSLVPSDLAPFADIDDVKAQAMIDDALAIAALVAPCITTDAFTHGAAAKAILRAAVLRWHEAGTGALTQRQDTRGPFGFNEMFDNRATRKAMFQPDEITRLQSLCSSGQTSGAFSIDTVTADVIVHADICSINFGATYCTCGAILTGAFPLYEV